MIQEELRKQTEASHHQLEKLVIAKLKKIYSDEDYVNLLKIFFAYFIRLEVAVKPYISSEILPDYAERRHAASLADDIISLGFMPSALPDVIVPSIDNTVKALGALYVMEGSIMGGRIIIQMLDKRGITQGISFFAGYGSDTETRWSSFVEVLDHYIKAENMQEAIQAAKQTISNLADVFLQA
ncbi:biliverdin-producing heme oxygenase [Flavobacterium aquidurense]|uniref:biliverdin-producing heme oxygenase n=1 Tax=Flavobacterium aquidurense TaxID=362413 RepID=UPI00375669E4